jgi:hypothetical protein
LFLPHAPFAGRNERLFFRLDFAWFLLRITGKIPVIAQAGKIGMVRTFFTHIHVRFLQTLLLLFVRFANRQITVYRI